MRDDIFSFGLSRAVPEKAAAAWGARWIFPDDIVWDRTSWHNGKSEAGDRLMKWLGSDGGAMMRARESARKMAASGVLTRLGQETVVLHEDEIGKIVGNPQRSHGYLYVAAWLK
jgi:hypothetical protein